MATTPVLISVEEYLHTSYHPDCDFVDVELEERHISEYPHGKLQGKLFAWFHRHEVEWAIDPVTEQRMYISSSRYRVCDVALLRANTPREDVTVTPPLLCIEIMSPEDRISRVQKVLEDYALMGVAQSWLIDPVRREAFVYDAKGLRTVEEDRLDLPGTPIYLILFDLFKALEKID